jgi:hypothetical protein
MPVSVARKVYSGNPPGIPAKAGSIAGKGHKRLELEVIDVALVKLSRSNEVARIVSRNISALSMFIQSFHIITIYALSFGTFDTKSPAPQVETPLFPHSTIKR